MRKKEVRQKNRGNGVLVGCLVLCLEKGGVVITCINSVVLDGVG